MAEKVILTDKYKKPYMPITRGELVLDSSGNPAFTSEAFLATPKNHGLLSASDKKKIDDITNTSYTLSGGLIENNYQVVLKSDDVNTSQATISSMVGASIITDENNNEVIKAGSAGLVPAPTDITTFLKGDGTWSVINNSLTANKLSEIKLFGFTGTKSNYCKVVSINITARYTGSSGLLRFYTNRSHKIDKADSFEVYLQVYQQEDLGNEPVLTFKSNNPGDGYDVIGILNISSTSTTFDLYVYGKEYTYHDLYVSLVQGNLTIYPVTSDSLPEGTQIKPKPMGNSLLLNGYKQGFTDGSIPIYIPFPGWTQLISKDFLIKDYESQNHPTEEFLKAICKWAINEYPNQGSITLIGNVSPNSSGTCILHLYSSSGKDSTNLPKYCRGQYLALNGLLYHFGTNDYVWSYGRFVHSTEVTVSSKSKNVTDKGWYRIATSQLSILRCLGTFEIDGSVSGKHTVTTVLSGINYSENPFITVLNTSHYTSAAITKVRIVYHTTYTNNYAYLEVYKDTTTSTSLTIKLANGYGWSLCDITTGSIPTGYSYKEMSLDNATLSTTGKIKSTTGEFTAIYNGSKIYATGQEILHADSNYFELNKGYPDSIMWFNASEYKFKVGSDILFMIASNGNVGIGNVGGAPAYKLHVGDGEVMANTYHAWSGGFKKNGSSDSYVLLGGGGHKAESSLNVNYATSAGNANTANYINYTSRAGKGNATAQFCQYSGETNNPTNDWYSHIIMNHANIGGYYTEIATCFHSDSVYFRRQVNGTTNTWKQFAWISDIPTVTDYYWADQLITNSSKSDATPTFGNVNIKSGTDAGLAIYTSGDYSRIRFYNASNSNNATIHYFGTGYGGYSFTKDTLNLGGSGGVTLGAWNNPTMFVTQNTSTTNKSGKLGIQTTSPTSTLDVNGDIAANYYKYKIFGSNLPHAGGDSWYNVYQGTINSTGDTILLNLSHSYWHTNTDAVSLAITVGYGNASINQISATGGSGIFKKVRVRFDTTTVWVDVLIYSYVASTDTIYISGLGKGDFKTPTATSDSSNTKAEISIFYSGAYFSSLKTDQIRGPFVQYNYNSWLSPAYLQLGRADTTVYTDRGCIGITNGNLHIDAYKNNDIYLNYYQAPGSSGQESTALVVKPTGNVGIGTASPIQKLQVKGAGVFNNTGSTTYASDGITIGAGDVSLRYITAYGKSGTSYFNMGYAASSRNCAELLFSYSSSGSDSNYVGLSLYGAENTIFVYPTHTKSTKYINAPGFVHPSYWSSAYALTSDGGVAHIGSMSVNYASSSGNADTVDGYHATDLLREFWTNSPGYDGNTYNSSPILTFSYSNNAPYTGVFVDLCSDGYGVMFNTSYYSDSQLAYKRHGTSSDGGMGSWRYLIDNVTIGSQSVNYANSAGTATGAYYVFDYNATTTPIYIGYANTSLTSATASYLAAYGTTSSGARCIKDISAAEAKKFIGLGNVQNTAFYKRDVTVNGTAWNMAGTNNYAAFTIYAPTTAGTAGLLLISNGSGAPVWGSLPGHSHAYLPLAGGTMNNTAIISRKGYSVSWYLGRDGAMIKTTEYNGYNPILSMKTTNGSWDLGVYNNDTAYLTYITDTDHDTTKNTCTYQLTFPKKTGTLAITSDIPSIPASLPANGGNADTVNGYKIVVTNKVPTSVTTKQLIFVY